VTAAIRRAKFSSGQLHDILVRLAGADDFGVRPHRDPSPLPLLDYFGIGLLDEHSDPRECLAPPITQLCDSHIDELRGRGSFFPSFEALLLFFMVVVGFFMVVVARPSVEYR